MADIQLVKQQIVDTCRTLVEKGYLMATGGNVSIRIPGIEAFAITPSNFDYLQMTPEDVCILNFDLKLLDGRLKPSVEAGMHLAIYRVRPDVMTVVHTHQVYASALALIKAPIPALFDEQVRFLGRSVEIIPYAPSGTGLLQNTIARRVRNHNNAYIMQNHGALIFATEPLQAIHNVEILEKCSLAYLLALLSSRPINKIPLAVREIAFSKLRRDQKLLNPGAL